MRLLLESGAIVSDILIRENELQINCLIRYLHQKGRVII